VYSDYKFDIISVIDHCYFFTEYLFNNKLFINKIYNLQTLPKDYIADKILIFPLVLHAVPPTLKFKENITHNTFKNFEVMFHSEVNLNIAVTGYQPSNLEIYNLKEYFNIKDNSTPKYDIIMHCGCNTNNTSLWNVKKYKSLNTVAKFLINDKFKVACIGSKDEYIGIGDDYTDIDITKSIELIRNCRLFISNDTGTYHIAAALKKPGFVIFTATSTYKNYDNYLHRTFNIIRRNDLKCSPCQAFKGNGYWLKCPNEYECTNILPRIIYNYAKEKLNEL